MLPSGYREGFAFRDARASAASATEAKGGGGNRQPSSANRREVSKTVIPPRVSKEKGSDF